MWTFIIALAVFFFVLANILFSDLAYEKLMIKMEEKSIENDGEPTILGVDLDKDSIVKDDIVDLTDDNIL